MASGFIVAISLLVATPPDLVHVENEYIAARSCPAPVCAMVPRLPEPDLQMVAQNQPPPVGYPQADQAEDVPVQAPRRGFEGAPAGMPGSAPAGMPGSAPGDIPEGVPGVMPGNPGPDGEPGGVGGYPGAGGYGGPSGPPQGYAPEYPQPPQAETFTNPYTGAYRGYAPSYGQRGYFNSPSYGYPPRNGQPYTFRGQSYGNAGGPGGYGGSPYGPYNYQAPRSAYAPAGLVIPVTLSNSISTQVAKDGDFVQASVGQNVSLGNLGYIPSGTIIQGQIEDAKAGRMMERSGSLNIAFNTMRLPNGTDIPIQAHVLGNIGKYSQTSSGDYRGEGWGTKLGNFALRTAIGAGGGALFGTAIGAIASHGHDIGTGAWSGTAIGGGLGIADDLFLRRGRDVLIHAGTQMQIQLDQPIQIPISGQNAAATSGAM